MSVKFKVKGLESKLQLDVKMSRVLEEASESL